MIKITKKTRDIIGTIIKHIHWNIWSFCLLFLVFKEAISLPLDFLYNFNFIPEFILNLSKLLISKPVEAIVPEVIANPTNEEQLITILQNNILLLQQEISIMNTNFSKLFTIIQDNNILMQKQISYQKELSILIEQKLSNLSITNDIIKTDLSKHLNEIIKTLRLQANGQLEQANKLIFHINENKDLLTLISNKTSTIDKSILNLDINKPLVSIQDTLNQIHTNQKDLYLNYQNIQDINLQSFNSILEAQHINFNNLQENLDRIFSKVNEVRNHNLDLYRQLDTSFNFKLEHTESKIVNQITDEINRPKTYNTEATKQNGLLGYFNPKNK